MSNATCPICGAACNMVTVHGIKMFGCACTGDRVYAVCAPPIEQAQELVQSSAAMRREIKRDQIVFGVDFGSEPPTVATPEKDAPRVSGLEAWLPVSSAPSVLAWERGRSGTRAGQLHSIAAMNNAVESQLHELLMTAFDARYDKHEHGHTSAVAHIALEQRVNPDINAPPPDPLDVEYDGVTLRQLLSHDEMWRKEAWPDAWVAKGYNRPTPAQRAAVSAHRSAELRSKVEAGKRADAARATSVVLDCAEEL